MQLIFISINLGDVFTPRFVSYLLVILAVALFGLFRYKRLSPPFKTLVQLIVLSFLSEFSTRLFAYSYGHSYPVYHIFIVASTLYHARIYYLLKPIKNLLKWVIGIYVSTVLFIEMVSIWIQGNLAFFPSLGLVVNSFFLVSFGLLLFRNMLRSPKPIPIFHQAIFWFNTGTLVFYSITFFVFGYFKHIMAQAQLLPEWCYGLIRFSNFVLLACYFLALYYNSQSNKNT
ncbi:hypothetical protein Oweho_0582 [Owenweeksia hongkongensis DSM 17368]|uniref:Uncharacterized protein n=1 Tax=Owenweeksia hongkongensis (strain DSM 17368 / CIP 108786 / JCM 12287 / NRRL B-23963 / UST20020801) TaxID=926562 RepID=G8R0D8_OWEHD|nr:hypothetical protein Oweho_0582 [Owenweeksia hongkongensis DSM 17368]